jgi:hypothetical protein
MKAIPLGLAASLVGAAGFIGLSAGPAQAQPEQDGLINVALVDTTVQVPLAVAANICNVNVNVLATQLDLLGETACGAEATATAVDGDGPGGGASQQNGLVNIYAEDTTVQVPVAVAANLCDINVNALARQLQTGDRTCDAVSDAGAES